MRGSWLGCRYCILLLRGWRRSGVSGVMYGPEGRMRLGAGEKLLKGGLPEGEK